MPDGGIIGYDEPCPYGDPGDTLWVRETWCTAATLDEYSPAQMARLAEAAGYAWPWAPVAYDASGSANSDTLVTFGGVWGRRRPSIHMPRWASRITLRVTSARVERLQSITDYDAIAEGISKSPNGHPEHIRFAELWDQINGKRAAWGSNPWVWRIEFERVEVPT